MSKIIEVSVVLLNTKNEKVAIGYDVVTQCKTPKIGNDFGRFSPSSNWNLPFLFVLKDSRMFPYQYPIGLQYLQKSSLFLAIF